MCRLTRKPLAAALLMCGTLGAIDLARADPVRWESRLEEHGKPASGRYDLRLRLHRDAAGNAPLAPPLELAGVEVRDGQLALALPIEALVAREPELWLQVEVRASGEADFVALPGRSQLKGGTACWSTAGNAGLSAQAFLGTTDADPLQLRSNNQRVMQYVANGLAPTLIGGHANNVALGIGVTIGGGGNADQPNFVTDEFGTIAGGADNLAGNSNGANTGDAAGAAIGGGLGNTARDAGTTVAGGLLNTAIGQSATVGGGAFNQVTATRGTIAGGAFNDAGEVAAVGGGELNEATGQYAMIPGGVTNDAAGRASFAAGSSAKALHDGSFVWADTSVIGDYASLQANQVRLRAAGGLWLSANDLGVSLADVGGGDPGEIVVESEDAQLYLMSRNAGGFGSVIALGEMASGNLVNSWGIVRETSGGGNDLKFTFGSGAEVANNDVQVEFRDDGTAFKASGSTSWDQISDQRLKTAIRPLDGALDALLQLRGVRFRYNAPRTPDGLTLPPGEQIGFLAQQVREVFPEWVGETGDGHLYIGERGSTALMVEALRELSARNEALEQRLAALEAGLAER